MYKHRNFLKKIFHKKEIKQHKRGKETKLILFLNINCLVDEKKQVASLVKYLYQFLNIYNEFANEHKLRYEVAVIHRSLIEEHCPIVLLLLWCYSPLWALASSSTPLQSCDTMGIKSSSTVSLH
jgi:hypothetical protein